MSSFDCKVYSLVVEEHPNADSLELGKIGGYYSIIPKGKFVTGDKVVYIPESAVLPENIIEELGLSGKLSGSKSNRVKALKLRGILSQGLVYKSREEWVVGQDVKDILGIIKYEAPIPVHLGGEVSSWDYSFKFDIDNIKKYTEIFKEGEEVVFTEKIHGTCTIGTFVPDSKKHLRKEDMYEGCWAISSKGLSKKNLFFKENEKNSSNNLYVKSLNLDIRKAISNKYKDSTELVTVVGESFGKVQDLRYDVPETVSFRLFGIKVGEAYLNFDELVEVSKELNITLVPILYRGPFSQKVLEDHTKGKEQVSGNAVHLREGLVVYPIIERTSEEIGRVILKSVSDDYLSRHNGTEFN
jgi:RNA ligase (TIGR02306 family)